VSLLQKHERVIPLFATHGDNAKVGVRRAGVGIEDEDSLESFLS
jgi:hypothetical protein